MKVRLHSNDLKEIIESSFPEQFKSKEEGGITKRKHNAQLLGGRGSYHELFMENIHIGHGDMSMAKDTEIWFDSDMETIELHFALYGTTQAEDLETKKNYQFKYNHHNIIYAAGFRGKSQYVAEKGVRIFEINLTPRFFQRFLPEQHTYYRRFRQMLKDQMSGMLSPINLAITPKMHLIIEEILSCQRQGAYQRMFIESKVIELLMLQLEQMDTPSDLYSYSLKKRDVDKIHAVKEYISENVETPCTLLNLARLFQTNEYTLKKGFKEVFGTSVHSYWNGIRMEQAKLLLIEHHLTVSEVADRIGYKNPQHFTSAFKKRYGFVPSRLK